MRIFSQKFTLFRHYATVYEIFKQNKIYGVELKILEIFVIMKNLMSIYIQSGLELNVQHIRIVFILRYYQSLVC